MSYKIENLNGCTKKLVFNFESVDLSDQINKVLKEKQKTANLKGFRPGKAPLNMIQKMYGPQIENDALYQFVSKEFFDAIEKEKIQAIGYPRFSNTKYESTDNTVSFDAVVEVMPEVSIKEFQNYKFSADPTEVTDEDLQKIEQQVLNSKSKIEAVSDESLELSDGLFASFDFEGEKQDGDKPESMKGKDYLLEIGSGQFILGFEEGMKGMKKGEEKTLKLTFPENYHAEELRNQKVKFYVKLNEIKEKRTPELSDDIVKEYGYENIDDFKEKTQKNLKLQKKRTSDEKLHEQILNKLIEENQFDIPNTMLAQQRVAVEDELKQNLKGQGFSDQMIKAYFEKWGDDLNKKAEFQVRSGLILNELAQKYEIEATEQDFESKLQEITEGSELSEEQVEQFYRKNDKIKQNIMYAIREEKTFDRIKKEEGVQIS